MQGRLAIGAALLGSAHVIGFDIDEAALGTCQSNLAAFEGLPVSQWILKATHCTSMLHFHTLLILESCPQYERPSKRATTH